MNLKKIKRDFEVLRKRFKTMDRIQPVYGKIINLEVYYNGSWALVELEYKKEEEMNKLIKMLEKEYSIQ